jgi:predicted DCC family thiol-disulfide oxidoreductase YuxK
MNPVILFDGICNLCNNSVQFVIRRDRAKQFRFASLQSEYGKQFLAIHQLPQTDYNSFILFENNTVFTRSTAALKVVRKLNGGWPVLYTLIVVPRFLRDFLYDLIARNRYRWFGKRETCWVPTLELKNLFFD